MARIRSYPDDTEITGGDRVLGTDESGSLNSTKQFSFDEIKEFVNAGTELNTLVSTPAGFFPIVDQDSTEVEQASIYQTYEQLAVDVGFYNAASIPADAPAVSENNFGSMVMFNSGDGWFFEIKNYTGEFHLKSFQGLSFTATVGSGDQVVTGTIGNIVQVENAEESDERDYYFDSNGARTNRYELTRTGTLSNTWDNLTLSVNIASEVIFAAADNENDDGDPETLQRVIFNVGTRVNFKQGVNLYLAQEEVTTDTNMRNFGFYIIPSSVNSMITLTLPANPLPGDWVDINNSATNLTNEVGRNGSDIHSLEENLVLDENASLRLVFVNNSLGWQIR